MRDKEQVSTGNTTDVATENPAEDQVSNAT